MSEMPLPEISAGAFTLARKDLSLAVDILTQLALNFSIEGKEEEIATFVLEASTYADANPSPAWISQIANDTQFIASLQTQLSMNSDIEAMGGVDEIFQKISLGSLKLKQAIIGITGKAIDKAGDFASSKLLAWARSPLNAILGRFFGDVFVYLDLRGDKNNPGQIPKRILAEFDSALNQQRLMSLLLLSGIVLAV